MKVNKPKSRYDLNIKNTDRVLDVGCGNAPHPRANVCVDKYEDSNYHRGGDLIVLKNQEFVNASGESLPFEDKSFDYVICCHVLEHVDDPIKFINELVRVGKKGYIEIPSLVGEFLVPKEAHKWAILDIEDKLVFVLKDKIGLDKPNVDLGHLFLTHLPSFSIGYKILIKTYPDILTVRYEWADNVDVLVNPEDEKYMKYFNKQWSEVELNERFPKKGLMSEIKNTLSALCKIVFDYTKPSTKNN